METKLGSREDTAVKAQPANLHTRFPRSLFPSYGYNDISGRRWLIGHFEGGRERPPFFASRIGTAGFRNLHSRGGVLLRAHRVGGRSLVRRGRRRGAKQRQRRGDRDVLYEFFLK